MTSSLRAVAALAGLIAVPVVGGASASAAPSLLAPSSVCPHQSDPSASSRVQAGAMRCLINYARARSGVRGVRGNRWLAVSARAKAAKIEACQVFSHNPCGAGLGYGLDIRHYRYAELGEVLYVAGAGSGMTPRAGMAAWLASPGHRRSLLNARFRDIGIAVRSPARFGGAAAAIWTADLGRRR